MTDLAVPTCNEAEDALASVLLSAPDKVAPLIVGANLDQRSFVQPDVGLVVQAALKSLEGQEAGRPDAYPR